MPKRTDIQNILIIGSGPIVIGQGCEFDYSGTQACKALREEGYSVVLINSNPATIMTDPGMADRTYVEPITPEFVERILVKERDDGRPVDAILPTLGGQTGLNCAMECAERGILDRHGVEMIGATPDAIFKAEDRQAFKDTMISIGVEVPRSGVARSWEEARGMLDFVKLPCCIRPAYTLGGEGGGFARTLADFERIVKRGLEYSRVHEVLIEEDLYGWKEFELEVMRDRADNVVIICSIENVDPMGVHTGDSITVAPAQTLTDKEYQKMRDSAIAIIRAIGVDTGGCNVQFAVDPKTGRQMAIEINPRVSRSSALASKATGYPIARIAAKLAVGYTLDELPNDITRTTPASFEPTIDYVVVKIPRWTFEKFPDSDETLTTQMKSVGEGMAIGRTFKEAYQKCVRSMEIKRYGFGLDDNDVWLRWHHANRRRAAESEQQEARIGGSTATEAPPDTEEEHAKTWPIPDDVLRDKLINPCQGRPYYIRYAFKMGWSIEQVHELTRIDPWFLENMRELVHEEDTWIGNAARNGDDYEPARFAELKSKGYSNVQLAAASRSTQLKIRESASAANVTPSYKLVDTCAAEFEASTPYFYSTHETPIDRAATVREGESDRAPTVREAANANRSPTVAARFDDEVRITDRPKIVVLGGGPNRIGQGIEFDYCCCHASYAARQAGYESVMVNSNPETVSTDYDTSDHLFFEPLTHEDTLNLIERINGAPLRAVCADPPKRSDFANESPAISRCHTDSVDFVKGVIVQFGGQTPLNLAQGLKDAGVPIIGTQPEQIHLAEDREQFYRVLRDLSILQPPSGIARSPQQALQIAQQIGYPVLVRPSYVLGGRGMKVCNNDADIRAYLAEALGATDRLTDIADNPLLVDKFLADAIEVDVDAVADYGNGTASPRPDKKPMCIVAGIMEHIEEAGVHSGDSTCVLPPFSLGRLVIEELFRSTQRLAERLQVCGAINIQYAILNRTVYVLEVNPRASRTLPFVAKATGVPWAKIATRVMLGEALSDVLAEHGISETPWPRHTAIKAPVFPFHKFAGVDTVLGPEMRSTGEVMAIASTFGRAFAKAQIATGLPLPTKGNVLVSVNDYDKPRILSIARELHEMGFTLYSTTGTLKTFTDAGIPATLVSKKPEPDTPYLLDLIEDGTLHLLINTPIHTGRASDEGKWRAAATAHRIPLITTLAGARAAVAGIRALTRDHDGADAMPLRVRPLQAYFEEMATTALGR